MTLAAGQTLSHYEILGPLGAGAMGEVYRARDTRLEREVALKVLPDELAGDEERLRRFEREAKTLASLNHPNVAQVFGIDRVEGTCFMAMELVPGEDLAARVARGPLPVDEAIDVCRQIAEGLEAAHEAGVVHRDLKPANVRITPQGVVKILDFGLAKPIRPKATSVGTTSSAESDSFLITEEGLVLGTPTYMSPEQARGKPVDRRTDIWAFGCVFYECLTGRRAYDGPSLADVLAAIVEKEPDWSRLPAVPPRVVELLRRALIKDPRLRLCDAGEARVQLLLAAREPRSAPGRAGVPPRLAVVMAGLVGAGALWIGIWLGRGANGPGGISTAGPPQRAVCAVVHEVKKGDAPGRIVISPDATRIAWTDASGLHVRDLARPEPRTILEHSELRELAWSPDGREIAYFDRGGIWRLAVEAGVPVRIADSHAVGWSTLEWMPDGSIAYLTLKEVETVSRDGLRSSLLRFEDPDIAHLDGFRLLPGGEGALVVPYYGARGKTAIQLARGEERREIVELPSEPSMVLLTADGLVLWEVGDALWGARISLDDLDIREEARVITEDWVGVWPSVAGDGTLAYLRPAGDMANELVSIDRGDGSLTTLKARHANALGGAFSWDGTRYTYAVTEGNRCEIWLCDFERGTQSPWIQRQDGAALSQFLPDGRLAVTPFFPLVGTHVYPASGKGETERLDGWLLATTPDGRLRVVADDVMALAGEAPVYLEGRGVEGGRRLLLEGEDQTFVALSYDARWMLHTSGPVGLAQVYLTRFPPDGEEWRVSAEGGESAWFAADGTEILYLHEHGMYRVALETEPTVRLGVPERLFTVPHDTNVMAYDGRGRFMGTQISIWGSVYVDTGGIRLDGVGGQDR